MLNVGRKSSVPVTYEEMTGKECFQHTRSAILDPLSAQLNVERFIVPNATSASVQSKILPVMVWGAIRKASCQPKEMRGFKVI